MSLNKTEKAKIALQNRDPILGPRDRQLLVLANGTRSRLALGELMGRTIDGDVDRMLALGLLLETRAPAIHAPLRPPRPASAAARPKPVFDVPKPVPVAQQQPLSRRSLAATKMYTMDMLQLLRHMDASSMAVSLHTSDSEAEFVANVLSAARLIAHKAGPSYALRVLGKLHEIIPQGHVPDIEALMDELTDTSAVV